MYATVSAPAPRGGLQAGLGDVPITKPTAPDAATVRPAKARTARASLDGADLFDGPPGVFLDERIRIDGERFKQR